MSKITVDNPYKYYPDPTKDRPVYLGYIYIGEPNTDPEIVGNQKAVTIDGVTPISQPIRTSTGGVPDYNGAPAALFVDGGYSIKVLNNKEVQVYYAAEALDEIKIQVDELLINDLSQAYEFDTINDMTNSSIPFPLKKRLTTKGYYAVGDGGSADYLVVAPQAFDGFADHELSNGDVAELQNRDGVIRAMQAGATFDGITDDTLAIQAAINLMTSGNNLLKFPVGTAIFTNLTLPEHLETFKISGEGRESTLLSTAITSGTAISGTWPDGSRSKNNEISDFALLGLPSGAATGFELAGFTFSDFIRMKVDDFQDCIIFNSQCYGVNVDSCEILHYSVLGIKQGNFNHWMTINRVQFSSSRGSSSIGFQGIGTETVENEALAITNCDFESSFIGCQIRNGGSPLISSCYFENNTGTHLRLGWSDRTLINPTVLNCYFNGNRESFGAAAKAIDWANYVEGGSVTNPHFLFDAADQEGITWNAGDRRNSLKSPVFTGFDQSYVLNTGDTKNTANYIGREVIEVDDTDLLLGWVSRVVSSINGELTITKVNGVVHVSAILSGGTVGTIYTLPTGYHPKTGQPLPVSYGVEGSNSIPTDLTLFIKRNGQLILDGTYDGTSQVNIFATYIPNVLGV